MEENEQNTKDEFSYFLETLSEHLKERYPGRLETKEVEALKNNSVTLRGLMVKEKESKVAPTFYLEQEFREYQSGEKTMKETVDRVADAFEAERQDRYEFSAGMEPQWDIMKRFITFRLINKEMNRQLLEKAPYEDFLDLALIYQCTLQVSKARQGTMQILNEHLEQFQISQEELRAAALENTKKIAPPVIHAMTGLLLGDMEAWKKEEKIDIVESNEMYVLTNTAGIYGAAVLVYKELLQQFAKAAGGGFYILPSSVHEVILVPDRPNVSAQKLAKTVKEVNATDVAPTDVLSDQVYYFDPEADCIKRLGAAAQ